MEVGDRVYSRSIGQYGDVAGEPENGKVLVQFDDSMSAYWVNVEYLEVQ